MVQTSVTLIVKWISNQWAIWQDFFFYIIDEREINSDIASYENKNWRMKLNKLSH